MFYGLNEETEWLIAAAAGALYCHPPSPLFGN